MRGGLTRNLSLVSGLILFVFALTHFLNHAVGLFSLELMDQAQGWRLAMTRSWPGVVILAAAIVIHIVFGLLKLLGRRTLRLPAWELAQLVLGIAIPFLLLPHVIDTHVAHSLFGVQDSYLYELARLWPLGVISQSLLLVIVWAHGCLGIHHWLKVKSWYQTLQPMLLLIAIAIPVAALAGFVVSGRAVAGLISDPAMAERMRALTHWPNSFNDNALTSLSRTLRIGFAVVVGLVIVVVAVRRFTMLAAPKIAVSYAGGPKIQSAIGLTLLEISRSNGIAHTSECGGRARCGTCRVRVTEGADMLPAPSLAERFTLARFNAPQDARLACQIRPTAALTVLRLVQGGESAGVAQPFADLRRRRGRHAAAWLCLALFALARYRSALRATASPTISCSS